MLAPRPAAFAAHCYFSAGIGGKVEDGLPLLLRRQDYEIELPRRSLDFQSRMWDIFGEQGSEASLSGPEVLVLTRTSDAEADAVGIRLAERGVSYLRVDADDLVGAAAFTLDEDAMDPRLLVGVRDRWLRDLRVVWFRHFNSAAIAAPGDDPLVRLYAQVEWRLAVRTLLGVESARWMNHPDAMHKLDRVAQLRLARRVGLATPPTVVSNDPERIRAFVASRSAGKAVVKALGPHLVEPTPGTLRGIFPFVVTAQDLEAAKAAALAPAMYQEYVPHTTEVRITVIGRRVIPVEIVKTDPKDIWVRPENVLVREHSLPDHIREKLLEYMRVSRLESGAIDLLLDDDHRYVFLEVNPVGAWRWLETRDDSVDITGAVAAHIVSLLEENA